jgi:hypothetical protein
MAYAVKYQFDFKTLQGDECIVYFFFKDYSGAITYLNPAVSPFVLREFNTDQDIFKPIRGFQAEIKILANNCNLEDFISGEDDGVQVQLHFNGSQFWVGWLMQDDFQEDWIDVNHVITLRATDGLGQIAQDEKVTIDGLGSIDEYIGYAIDSSPIPTLLNTTILNTLFYNGMLDRTDGNYQPLNQAFIDGKTFEGDNNQTMLEKINKAWGQSIFQYEAKWMIARWEEFFHNDNVLGVRKGAVSNTNVNKSYNVNIGVNEDIKPIAPLMLRTIRRPFKETKITYRYEFPREIVCNQTFLNGSLIPPTTNTYTIDCWTLEEAPISAPTAGVLDWYRKEDLDGDGNVIDNYVFIERLGTENQHWIKSQPVKINANDVIDISLDYRTQGNTTNGPANINVALVRLTTSTDTYYMDDDGNWEDAAVRHITASYSSLENSGDWKSVERRSKAAPGSGEIEILLTNVRSNSDANFRDLRFEIRESTKQPGVVGDFDRYTLTETIRNNYEEQTYLDDSNNNAHKGALFFNDELTGDNWYRHRYPSERLTFKRQKAISHMLLNRRYRNRLEVNMLGLKWFDSADKPIGLMNRFVFVDDAPTKSFMIANLSEMDFMNGTWKATLIEVYDSAIDTEDTGDYPTHDFGNIYAKDV